MHQRFKGPSVLVRERGPSRQSLSKGIDQRALPRTKERFVGQPADHSCEVTDRLIPWGRLERRTSLLRVVLSRIA